MFRIFKKRKDQPGKVDAVTVEESRNLAQGVQSRPGQPQDAESLDARLAATRGTLGKRLNSLIQSATSIDDDLLEELETTLIMADIGVAASLRIMESLNQGIANGVIKEPSELLPAVQAELYELIEPCEQFLAIDRDKQPFVILMVGVNGVGKTTTIGKLAQRYQEEGLKVMLAAGDTFRAAAVGQLQSWGQRNNIPVVAQDSGADSASVIFDAFQSAKARGIDVLIADTAGRLHTQSNLMEELKKIHRVIGKLDEEAPHEVMLVLDAGTGQNALAQARQFNEAVGLTGLTLSKLDGTAKGGVLFALAEELKLPIRFIGVGEGAADLRPFDAGTFIHAILPVAD